mmetsp:Transcript_2635/g.6049  ORF Transcript_2635/g.6049 Transcript_2635/m.6049 type:complete len:575 (-) Transcript_2635:295-2019(-)|eukprot:CAMPEP_0114528284 /NCGR_PEP_ID=MMETSP0109-20121206/24119_1 /TAXON_ID=29199 /ORGANISM="Chlorarachnion reptans, Strain CCCM449" /LENGTH=574 /DNA_ID=CAMNT_0001710409 /DNA_START=210 /DNA_END=1934 /DNA_ORIENTATION=-
MTTNASRKREVGPYMNLEKIGKGAFATVYLGMHRDTGAKVAIKGINLEKANEKETAQINSEINILRDLNHPNIVRLLDIQRTTKHIFIIMEYCSGGDLSKYIKKHRMIKENKARTLLRQLACGLECLRNKKLMHRDLKPANLLIEGKESEELVLKIADFGFARHLEAEMAQTQCGTPLYMAPEILENKPYDSAAELWSVGAILFEMVTGRAPFKAPNQFQLIQKIKKTGKGLVVSKEYKDKFGLSDDCARLIEGLLKRNPKDRMNFENFFKHPFLTKILPSDAKQGERSKERKYSIAEGARIPSKVIPSGLSRQIQKQEEAQMNSKEIQSSHNSGEYILIDKPNQKPSLATQGGPQNFGHDQLHKNRDDQKFKSDVPKNDVRQDRTNGSEVENSESCMKLFAARAKGALLIGTIGETNERAHRLVESVQLYTRALELFHRLLEDIKVRQARGVTADFAQKISQLRSWALNMSKVFLDKAKNLAELIHGPKKIKVSVDELIYDHAIKTAKDGAFDETVGAFDMARKKYKTALRLFKELSVQKGIGKADLDILDQFMKEFTSRIDCSEQRSKVNDD